MSYNDYLTNFWGKVPYSGGIHGVKPTREKSTRCIIFHLISRHLSMSPSLILTRLRPTMQLSTETILDYYQQTYVQRPHFWTDICPHCVT